MKFDIHRATGAEIEAARDLTNRSWLSTYPSLIGEETTRKIIVDRHSSQLFVEQASRVQDRFLVAVDGATVVGHLYAFQKEGMYVDRLHVDPTRKGQGVGRALLAHLERQLFADTRCWLDVLTGSDAAIRFYERVGYKRVGETDACGGLAGIPAVIYEKIME
ncbi:MAG: GNAT family N-acetyltransferase [Ahrensia sp.]|nr:GNAT family N-acetyltransferase [Ahrensia sp.]